MELLKIEMENAERLAPLVAAFRVQLNSYKSIKSQPDVQAGKEEIIDLLRSENLTRVRN